MKKLIILSGFLLIINFHASAQSKKAEKSICRKWMMTLTPVMKDTIEAQILRLSTGNKALQDSMALYPADPTKQETFQSSIDFNNMMIEQMKHVDEQIKGIWFEFKKDKTAVTSNGQKLTWKITAENLLLVTDQSQMTDTTLIVECNKNKMILQKGTDVQNRLIFIPFQKTSEAEVPDHKK